MSAPNIAAPDVGLNPEQLRQLGELAHSLRPDQALWISGYFAGVAQARSGTQPGSVAARPGAVTATAAAAGGRSLTILYGSETGNSAALAKSFARAAAEAGLQAQVCDMADYKTRKLKDEQDLIIFSSTHGEGDPPQSALAFTEFLESRKAPKLPAVRFGVLALGDSTYEKFCEAGRRFDRRLLELGATRLLERVDCDVDYEEPAAAWVTAALAALKPVAGAPDAGSASPDGVAAASAAAFAAASADAGFDKRRPFAAQVIENIALTGRGSSKETRHIELSLEGSGLTYEPGDALGVVPRNDPALVDALLQATGLSSDAPAVVKGRATTLAEALAADFEISTATPRLIDHWAQVSDAAALRALAGEGGEQRNLFLREHHVVDVLRRFPVKGIDAQTLLGGLRPLQPRLYSIASSQAAVPDEAHLTVSTVRYRLHGEPRAGVASSFFAERALTDSTVPVYVQCNPHFRLAADHTPIVMIGAGTGIAPYRAFLQQREINGAGGRSWLILGERNFHTDFLYQTEWQRFLKDGVLSRMNVAFSRDREHKTYVQHRLREHARELYAWLEEGAHLYVCGDASRLAPDVHAALTEVVSTAGGRGPEQASEYVSALQREHRYLTDVY